MESVDIVEDNGTGNGNITPYFSGGVPPYSFLWHTLDTTAQLLGVEHGSYALTITDANGCSNSFEFEVPLINSLSEAVEEITFTVFPNPVRDLLTVRSAHLPPMTLSIINSSGLLVYQQVVSLNPSGTSLDLSSYPPGIYLLQMTNKDDHTMQLSEKIIKL